MICTRCRKSFDDGRTSCPHCGEPRDESAGVFQTSTVLISDGRNDLVYRSVDEVPAELRTKLLKTTNSTNSATILIADRRGRQEIAKSLRGLPGSERRWGAPPSARPAGPPGWLTTGRKRAIAGAIAFVALAVITIVFANRWR